MCAMWSQITDVSIGLFGQPFVQVQNKEHIKAPRHWTLWGESTGHQLILLTKGQQRGKCFIWWRHHAHDKNYAIISYMVWYPTSSLKIIIYCDNNEIISFNRNYEVLFYLVKVCAVDCECHNVGCENISRDVKETVVYVKRYFTPANPNLFDQIIA